VFAFTHFEKIIIPGTSSDLFCPVSIRSDILNCLASVQKGYVLAIPFHLYEHFVEFWFAQGQFGGSDDRFVRQGGFSHFERA
jgi:hypothetical protein